MVRGPIYCVGEFLAGLGDDDGCSEVALWVLFAGRVTLW
jgi:hypothetical protein